MSGRSTSGLTSAIAWLVFPIVPVVLEESYSSFVNMAFDPPSQYGPDPHDWGWQTWNLMLGPLLGYGFLAGATLGIADEPCPRRWRRWLSRRAVWVGVGPWAGALAAVVIVELIEAVVWALHRCLPSSWSKFFDEQKTFAEWSLWLGFLVSFVTVPWAWLGVASSAIRRAARIGEVARALWRGLALALGFVGSLFGSFWAVTSFWRNYFFDKTLMSLAIIGIASITFMSGCASPITAGEVRRRGLFHAMLLAWVLGLALAWRWWARPKPRPPAR